MDHSEYLEHLETWREGLDEALRARDGWLALAGLEWLSNGILSVGSEPDNDIVLPAGAPPQVGHLIVEPDQVSLASLEGLEVERDAGGEIVHELRPDITGNPTKLRFGPVTIMLIQRGGRRALRIWDNSRAVRDKFAGRRWHPPDPRYRVRALISRSGVPGSILVPDEAGVATEEPVAGEIAFTINGRTGRLIALPREGDRYHLIFKDATSGETTYGAGRYLIAGPADSEALELDFNYAYNPPCAFTQYATCSLPPPQNRLSFPIHAGELAPT